jgi:hypothetical protein
MSTAPTALGTIVTGRSNTSVKDARRLRFMSAGFWEERKCGVEGRVWVGVSESRRDMMGNGNLLVPVGTDIFE